MTGETAKGVLKREREESLRKLFRDIPSGKFDEIIDIIHNLKDKE